MSNLHSTMEYDEQPQPQIPRRINKITKQRSLMNQSSNLLSAKKLKLFSMIQIDPHPSLQTDDEYGLNDQQTDNLTSSQHYSQYDSTLELNKFTKSVPNINLQSSPWDNIRKQAEQRMKSQKTEVQLQEEQQNKLTDLQNEGMLDSNESIEIHPTDMEEETIDTATSFYNSKQPLQDIMQLPSFSFSGVDMQQSKSVSIFDDVQTSSQGTHIQHNMSSSQQHNQLQLQHSSSWFYDVLPRGIKPNTSPFKNINNNNTNNTSNYSNNSLMGNSSQVVSSCLLKPIMLTSTNPFSNQTQNYLPAQPSTFSQQALNNHSSSQQQKSSFYSSQLPMINMTQSINCSNLYLQQHQQEQIISCQNKPSQQFPTIQGQQSNQKQHKKPIFRLLAPIEPFRFSLPIEEEEQSRNLENKINEWLDAEGVLQVEPNAQRKISNSKNLSILNPLTSSLIARRKLANLSLH